MAMPPALNSVGDPPKSPSMMAWAPGTCHAALRARVDASSRTMEFQSPGVPSCALPVVTQTDLVPAATLDHTLPPIEPDGTVNQVAPGAPECWSYERIPPWIRGVSH